MTDNLASSRIVILAAIDDTAASDDVLRTAAMLGQTIAGTELHLFHVVKVTSESDAQAIPAVPFNDQLENARTLMNTVTERARTLFAGRVVQHLAMGTPARAILQAAANLHADLIVVGSHGKKGVERWLLGSVSEQVVRKASCAVLVARPKDYRASAPEIEPPCPDCLVTQRQTAGDKLWCARHDQAKHPHANLHYQAPQPFAIGSTLLRPAG